MQMDQLFEFVYILIDKKQVTAKEMSEWFGVSIRTVYRWVEALSLSGVPLYAVKGRGGGIAISEKYALDNTVLSEDERLEIVSSLKALNKLSGNKNERAAEKLSHLVKSDADWLEVDFSPWSPEGQGVNQLFGILRDSILKKRQVVFDYYNGSGRLEHRTVHPWKLIYRGQAWYLRGWCSVRKAERFFKLSRMINVEETSCLANVTEKYLAAIKKELISEAGGEKQTVSDSGPDSKLPLVQIKANVSAGKAFYLLDMFACSETQTEADGSLTVTFSAPDADWLIGNLLSFGADLKIISPEKIKSAIIKKAGDTVKIYK